MDPLPVEPLQNVLRQTLARARARVRRPISQWMEEEIWLPNGPFAGLRYRHFRHPVSSIWFDEIDSGRWVRFAASAPQQQGKTLMCYIGPVLYHVFELGETVGIGLPDMNMANDKWLEDFLPVIEASRYRDLLPVRGEGSQGGQVKRAIRFRNGATLRFFSGGGSDKKRAGFTTRVVAITETDGMDSPGEHSREADKIEQIEGRTRAFGRTGKRVYLECTVSIEKGRIWQEIKNGSDSKLVRPCPYCGHFVSPEREHLVGWQLAESEGQAADLAHWICPECEHPWTESDRKNASQDIQLVHRGQEITPEGEIVGVMPNTQTLGFRWSAIDNPFVTAADLGAEEWLADRAADHENAEKKMRQFVWAIPYEPPDVDLTPLEPEAVRKRTCALKKGVAPEDCFGITVGIDTGKYWLHWFAIAWTLMRGHVIDYGKQSVPSQTMGVRKALIDSLANLKSYFDAGWMGQSPRQVWVDAHYSEHTDAVYEFCRLANTGRKIGTEIYRPSIGYGEGQRRLERYFAPKEINKEVRYVGPSYHFALSQRAMGFVVHLDANAWKSELHQRLSMPADERGAIVFYEAADAREHFEVSQHLTAEKQVEQFVEGKGEVIVWDRIRRQNHYLDAAYSSVASGNFVQALMQRKPSTPKPQRSENPRNDDGDSPFLASAR